MKSKPPRETALPRPSPGRKAVAPRKGSRSEAKAPPIFVELYDLVLLLYQVVRHFPKSQKFVLGQRIETTAVDVLAAVIEGNLVRDKAPHLHRASVELDKLRVFVRLARDLQFMDFNKYEAVSEHIDRAGRMLGGWIKWAGKEEAGGEAEQS